MKDKEFVFNLTQEFEIVNAEITKLQKQLEEKTRLRNTLLESYNILVKYVRKAHTTLDSPQILLNEYKDEATRKDVIRYLERYVRVFFPTAQKVEITNFVHNTMYVICAQINDSKSAMIEVPDYDYVTIDNVDALLYTLHYDNWIQFAIDPTELIQPDC